MSDTWVCCFPVSHFPLPVLPELHKVHLTLLTRGAAGIPSKDTHHYSEDAVQECGSTGEAEAGGLSSRAILQNCVSKNKTPCPNPISHHVLKQVLYFSSWSAGRCDSYLQQLLLGPSRPCSHRYFHPLSVPHPSTIPLFYLHNFIIWSDIFICPFFLFNAYSRHCGCPVNPLTPLPKGLKVKCLLMV